MSSGTTSNSLDIESRWVDDDTGGEAESPQVLLVGTDIVDDREGAGLEQHSSENTVHKRQSFSTFHTNVSVMTDISLQAMSNYAIDPDREVQRTKVLRHVATAHPWRARRRSFNFGRLGDTEQKDRLYSLAKKICAKKEFVFCRFRQLSIFNILEAQHRLILMEEKLQYDYGESPPSDEEEREELGLGGAFNAYLDAIRAFQTLEGIKPPDRKHIKPMSANLAHKLHEPHYWDGPDALMLLDLKQHEELTLADAADSGETTASATAGLAPISQTETTDSLRLFLQMHAPDAFLDKKGKEQSDLIKEQRNLIKNKRDPEHGGAGTQSMLQDAFNRREALHISPFVDFSARVLICLFGGVSLLTPVIALVFVKDSLTLTLVLTTVFVLVVVTVLPLVCRASTPNEALLGATAGYVAVLVVFVANVSVAIRA